jgi:hypothetical protein
MYFIQFFHMSTGYVQGSIPPRFDNAMRTPIEATGDRSVIVLDGRESASTHHNIARVEGAKRGFIGYKICKGSSFSRVDCCTGFHAIRGVN